MSTRSCFPATRWRRLTVSGAVFFAFCVNAPGSAAPPFNTDFAEPTPYGSAELDIYAETTQGVSFPSATLPGLEVDYGVAPDFQARIVVPISFADSAGSPAHYGLGDLQLGLKYRFLNDNNGEEWWPQLALFPLLLVPTGNAQLGLGQGGPAAAVPIWLQKNLKPWKLYGGGGYVFDYGRGTKDSWFLGAAVVRQISEHLSLGGELFHKTANRIGAADSTIARIGGSYDFNETYHMYFSIGRSLQAPSKTGEIAAYIALALTF